MRSQMLLCDKNMEHKFFKTGFVLGAKGINANGDSMVHTQMTTVHNEHALLECEHLTMMYNQEAL